jgi:hypothetical protein
MKKIFVDPKGKCLRILIYCFIVTILVTTIFQNTKKVWGESRRFVWHSQSSHLPILPIQTTSPLHLIESHHENLED